jgi:Xaa-Pro aminopeptidase
VSDFPPAEFLGRLRRAQQGTAERGIDALLVTPGPNLRYLTGYNADTSSERITCLVAPAEGDPLLLVPQLEVALARSTTAGDLGIEIVSWPETEDSIARLVGMLPRSAQRLALDDHMWAVRVLDLRRRLPTTEQVAAGPVISPLRVRKTPAEVEALRRAGAAIDQVHEQVPGFLRPGRTEREVGKDIADAILATGHATVDFVIVGSGPNGASPHAEVSDRVIQPGEPVVVDIGGAMPDGYFSDSTRTYCIGDPPKDFLTYYEVLHEAQLAQCAAARPGITAADLDALGREMISGAGYGPHFIHRTGHGIGLEVHEEPYIVATNPTVLEEGMTFSVEPGIYLDGRHGARIEDILVCSEQGDDRCNLRPRELAIV